MADTWKHRVAPDLQKAYARMPKLTFGPWTVRGFRLMERLMPLPPLPDGVQRERIDIDGRPALLFRPTGDVSPPGALLWLHGGGRVIGHPVQFAVHAARLVAQLGIVVLCPSYRWAPEHPFPAPLDDVARAWRWLVEQAPALGVSPSRLGVGGESAGGGLAAELTQRLLDEGGVQPCAQALVYPMLDDRTAAEEALTALAHPVWSNASNHFAWRSYLGVEPGTAQLPAYASASRREDLSGLPPAWLTVGELDLFQREDEAYAERLRAAGVPAELLIVPGGFHGFFIMGREEPSFVRVWESLVAFLASRLVEAAPAAEVHAPVA